MSKALLIEPDKCTSCRLCELACSARNAGAFRPTRSRIQVAVNVDEAFYFPMVCFQCPDAPCVEQCPTQALERDPSTGLVRVLEDLCNECGVCETACPYGVIRCMDGKARKCELCGGEPECVRFCAPGALRYEPTEQWPSESRQAYAGQLRELCEEARR